MSSSNSLSKLPSSLSKLKGLGSVQDTYEVNGVIFILRNVNSKEHLEIIASTATVEDAALRWELIKQKTLKYAIVSVDGQVVDNDELIKYFEECSPVILQYLFNKYMTIANKGAELVDQSVEKIELAGTNISNNIMGTAPQQPQASTTDEQSP